MQQITISWVQFHHRPQCNWGNAVPQWAFALHRRSLQIPLLWSRPWPRKVSIRQRVRLETIARVPIRSQDSSGSRRGQGRFRWSSPRKKIMFLKDFFVSVIHAYMTQNRWAYTICIRFISMWIKNIYCSNIRKPPKIMLHWFYIFWRNCKKIRNLNIRKILYVCICINCMTEGLKNDMINLYIPNNYK